MNNVVHIQPQEQVIDQAVGWITKIDRGLSSEEKRLFLEWLKSSARHREVFIQYAQLWDKMDAVSMLGELFPEPEDAKPAIFSGYRAIAASVVGAAIVGSALINAGWVADMFGPAQTIVVQQEFSTDVGERATFYMQDKTKVELNTNSKLRVTYTDKQRLFELEHGELHVTVAHNDQLPLSVYADGQVIQAVGTAFNVEVKHEGVELIVTDGKVLVADQPEQNPLSLRDVRLPQDATSVSKGQWLQFGQANEKVTNIAQHDEQALLSWQSGELIFRGEPLVEALMEVERYTHYQFRYTNDALKQIKVAGLFKTDDLDSLLVALEDNFSVEHHKLADNIIQLSPATL